MPDTPIPRPDGDPPACRVVESVDGEVRPIPNGAWSTPPDEDGVGIHSLIGLRADPDGMVRILDIGDPEAGHLPKLVPWDTAADRLHRRRSRPRARDDRLLWPDGFCCGAGGHVYVTVTQLHRAPPFNRGEEESYHPFKLFRVESLAPVPVGR